MTELQHKHGGDVYSYGTVLDFSANINFLGMPEPVRRAALAGVDASVHYPDPQCRALRRALSAREEIPPEQILCGSGAAELLFALCNALRPRRALLVQPSFFEYEQALLAAGCNIEHLFLKEERKFSLSGREWEQELEQALKKNYDLLILGNPNNPTGGLWPKELLAKLLFGEFLCGARLVLDESFFDFLCREDLEATLEGVRFLNENRGVLVLKSFTKMYAMPGLRFGYLCSGDPALLERMRGLLQPWNVSVPAQMAAQAAAGELEFARRSADETAGNRRRMEEQLKEMGFQVFPSCANYLLVRGVPGVWDHCLRRGILVRDCSNFRGLDKRFFRVCIRSGEENRRLLDVLRSFRQT